MGQMIPINLPADGNWPTIVGDSIMIIGPRQNELTEEQRYFNPVYLMTYPGKEHLKAQMIRAGACDCDPTIPNRRIGVFSVAPNKQVSFSQGNLQYLPAINLWKFADTQYEYLGNSNKYLSPTYRNWVDLFGWSGEGSNAPFGVSTSTNNTDYAGEFLDWGTNPICGDAPSTWRSMSADEWMYIFHGRKNAESLFACAKVNGVSGVVLLPDDWILPEGLSFIPSVTKGLIWSSLYDGSYSDANTTYSHYQDNSYTLEQWQKMEDAGAVFLPAAGYRNTENNQVLWSPNKGYAEGTTIGGSYFTHTKVSNSQYYFFRFSDQEIRKFPYYVDRGRSVRLVHDTIVPKPEPEYVDLGLSVKWATFNVGATSPEDYGDYFAWGETEPKETYSWATYKWGDGTQNTMTKYNATDGKTILEPEDDAAHVHWGDKWRMPTYEEQMELLEKCSWERTNLDGVIGYKVTGPNGNSIFIPIAGAYNSFDNQLNSVGSIGWIYSSTKATGTRAYEIHIEEGIIQQKDCSRCVGLTIRPVYDDKPPKRIGVFSVAADKQVSFSQGNLQYVQSTDTWQFAANQLEYMGHKHYRNGQLADTIEYFGWSGKNSKAPWGISLSTESSDYAGEFLDWGTNTIAGSAPNTWRTLSNDEWLYICQGRKNADQLLGLGKISSIFGLIILPDDWAAPEGITFTPNDNNPNANVYSLQQWTAMEEAGAIFIPPTGYFNHDIDNMRYVGTYGYARNNTLTANGLQIYTLFKPSEIQYSRSAEGNNGNLYYAFPQRLVHDTIVPKPEPEYVDLGLSVKWATFNVGATSPEDNGDYFAWGETETKDKYSWATYKWCDGTDANMTKYNKTDGKTTLELADDAAHVIWGDRWRMPTKAEMQELFDKCTWEADTVHGMSGKRVTGPNGNSIFIPTTGYYNDDHGTGIQGLGTIAYLWTSSTPGNANAYDLLLYHSTLSDGVNSNTRRVGMPIRPVYDENMVTLTINCTPEDAEVGFFYKEGFHVHGNSVMVKKGSSPLYQVTATEKGYLSFGDTLHNITRDTTLNITLRPFSEGTWVKVDTSEYKRVDTYYVSRNGGYAGPYNNWSYFYAPALPGETYRVRAHAGQLAAIWYAASNAPDQAAGIRPKKVACSKNGGITRYIAEEFTIPEGANHLIINASGQGKNLIIERLVPDPCMVVPINDTLSINMMCVEGGTFMMGAMEGDTQAHANEKPAHEVTLTYDYYIGQTEVTQALWKAVMGNNPSTMIGDDLPVNNVLWEEADAFVKRLSQMTGYTFHLPTEAEWEFAARGGNKSQGYLYAGSNNIQEVAWYGSNSGNTTQPVGTKQPNELGIYDMSGNVIEWCSDWLGPYSAEAQVNPIGPATGAYHVYCGGCWYLPANVCRCTHRRQTTVGYGEAAVGLRVALREKV